MAGRWSALDLGPAQAAQLGRRTRKKIKIHSASPSPQDSIKIYLELFDMRRARPASRV